MDMISEHYYSYANRRFDVATGTSVPLDPDEPLADWMRRPANPVRITVEAYDHYLELIPALRAKRVPIAMDEWAYAGTPPNGYRVVPAYAWAFHEMFRPRSRSPEACRRHWRARRSWGWHPGRLARSSAPGRLR